jgi:hypothetical protein
MAIRLSQARPIRIDLRKSASNFQLVALPRDPTEIPLILYRDHRHPSLMLLGLELFQVLATVDAKPLLNEWPS